MSLKYEPALKPLHVFAKQLLLNWLPGSPPVNLKAIQIWILSKETTVC